MVADPVPFTSDTDDEAEPGPESDLEAVGVSYVPEEAEAPTHCAGGTLAA